MTHTEANITHIMFECPRGFANEQGVTPIPHALAVIAQDRVDSLSRMNPEGEFRLIAWDAASPGMRSQCGYQLRTLTAADGPYEDLVICDLIFDPSEMDRYQWDGSQFVRADAAA